VPGWELIDNKEKEELSKIFSESNGVMFAHGFDERRNNIFRVRNFEEKMKKYFGVKYCLATTSGTMAQYIAMKAMGIGPGDEVITQSFTFVATIEAILALGAQPIVLDINETYNLDYSLIENAITKKTKLIIPVHMLGNQCQMDEILNIGKKYNIPVMEDACEALGAEYKSLKIGSLGEVGIFSLDFGKTITTGEGGLIITNDDNLHNICREFHDHGHQSNKLFPRGKDSRNIYGLNLRMSELQAAVGIAQIDKLDFIVEKNRLNKHLVKSNIDRSDKIKFRDIVDVKGDLADTLIFNFEEKKYCDNFLKQYLSAGYSTKNLPDAYDWHFAGTWKHMFKNDKKYQFNWHTCWDKSADLLSRSISIPILVNTSENESLKHANDINLILKSI